MKAVLKSVLTSILTAAILGTAAGVWKLVIEVHDLRQDVDRLYAEVSEHMQEGH